MDLLALQDNLRLPLSLLSAAARGRQSRCTSCGLEPLAIHLSVFPFDDSSGMSEDQSVSWEGSFDSPSLGSSALVSMSSPVVPASSAPRTGVCQGIGPRPTAELGMSGDWARTHRGVTSLFTHGFYVIFLSPSFSAVAVQESLRGIHASSSR